MYRKREFTVFGLSFLDVMSCGFGAVILIYILINHATESTSQEINMQLLAEVRDIEEKIEDETDELVVLRNTVNEKDDEIITTEELILLLVQAIRELEIHIKTLAQSEDSKQDAIIELQAELRRLEEEAARLAGSVEADATVGVNLEAFEEGGDRQYLTGLRTGGNNILILMDASASMLGDTIVNIIRRRNMSDNQKLQSAKWQRAIRTVEWITANLPGDTQFQLYTFNTDIQSAIPGKESEWLNTLDREDREKVIDHVKSVVPGGGTSLHHAFARASALEPEPDNIFLIVDGLPTQGFDAPRGTTISSRDRVELFLSSIAEIPSNSSINIILFQMEGDPMAAPSYWRLAQMTGGSFLAPSEDWP